MAGRFDDILSGFKETPDASSTPSGKYGDILASFQSDVPQHPDPSSDALNFERSSSYPNSRMTDTSVQDYGMAKLAIKSPSLIKALYQGGKSAIGVIGSIPSKIKSTLGVQPALEEALGSAAQKYGTSEVPSVIGGTARQGLQSGEAYNEAMAQKLYGQVPKDVPVSTPRIAAKYGEIGDELSPTLQNAIKKNVQLEPNPIRAAGSGEHYGITTQTPDSVRSIESSLVDKTGKPISYLEEVPGSPNYGVGYKASPGVPSQLPPNRPPVSELIKLRSKLGAASRSGGIEGFNASQLRSALDEDIANLGQGEGPLGKMTEEAVNEPLKKATHYYRGMMEQQSTPLYNKLANGNIEDIPKIIFRGGRTQDVLEARALIGEEGFQAAKKSFFNELLDSKDVGKAVEKYSKNNSDFLPTVFNRNEMNSLNAIVEMEKKAQDAALAIKRAKMLMTGAGVAAVGGGVAGKAIKFGAGQ